MSHVRHTGRPLPADPSASPSVAVLVTDRSRLPEALEQNWTAALPSAVRDDLAAIVDPQVRRRRLVTQRLLGAAFDAIGLNPSLLDSLSRSAGGRPRVDGRVSLSISHAEGVTACAVARDVELGLDLERLGDVTADRFPHYLDADERAWAGENPRRFYRLWTAKEAVVKAAGDRGLRAVPDVRVQPVRREARFESRRWRLHALPLHPRLTATLACEPKLGTVPVRWLPLSAL